jgi:hypothetical protein
MLAPTTDEITAAKAECRKRFGHDRIVRIIVAEPVGTHALVAAFNLAEATVYHDARFASPPSARSALIAERCLWPSMEALEEIRTVRRMAAVDVQIEGKFRELMGFIAGAAHARPLSVATAPPSFVAGLQPKEASAKVAELQKAYPGEMLWSVYRRENALELMMRQPTSDVWTAATVAAQAAQESNSHRLTCVLDFARDHVVWSPRPIDAYFDEAPGRADDIALPFFEMGGAGATASASFL